MSRANFDQVAELASQLAPREQLKLVAQIGARLSGAPESVTSGQAAPGSAAAVLEAMLASPKLDSADVDALEAAIQSGRTIVRFDSVFEGACRANSDQLGPLT
jgi:hypothetical protein